MPPTPTPLPIDVTCFPRASPAGQDTELEFLLGREDGTGILYDIFAPLFSSKAPFPPGNATACLKWWWRQSLNDARKWITSIREYNARYYYRHIKAYGSLIIFVICQILKFADTLIFYLVIWGWKPQDATPSFSLISAKNYQDVGYHETLLQSVGWNVHKLLLFDELTQILENLQPVLTNWHISSDRSDGAIKLVTLFSSGWRSSRAWGTWALLPVKLSLFAIEVSFICSLK